MSPPIPRNSELNFGIYLPNWNVGPDTNQLVELAVGAADAGWDGVYFADHLVFPHDNYDGPDSLDFHDPWITMSAIATRTDDLTMGSWVTPIPRRQPWQLARNLATLDQLSNGRVRLGTGLGIVSTNYTPFGRTADTAKLAQRYDEALEVIDGLWMGEPFSFDGEHFTVDEAVLRPTPVQEPRIPIIAGGVWPNKEPIKRGARWDGIAPAWKGDGILPGGLGERPEETLRELLAYYHEQTDAPGEIMLPMDPPGASAEYLDVCRELGATWVFARDLRETKYRSNTALAMDRIMEGPPE